MDSIPPIDDVLLVREVKGLGRDDRRYRQQVATGRLVRLHRGAFADRQRWDSLPPDQQYRLRCVGAVSAGRSRPVLSHQSAAAFHGIPRIGPPPTLVHVLASERAGTRTEHGFRKHASRHPEVDVVSSGHVRLTGLDRTLVELVSTAPFSSGVVALDWALASPTPHLAPGHRDHRPPRTSGDALLRCAEALELKRGRTALLRALEFADGRAESPGESLSRVLIHELGFPAPKLQKEFFDDDGLVGRVDFWWPDHNLIGEFDGIAKYVREEYRRGLSAGQVVLEEKRREDRLRALGPRVTRWEWASFTPPQRLYDSLRRAGLPSWRRSGWEPALPARKRAGSA